MVQIRQYTWEAFDRDITILANKLNKLDYDLLYGNPRGGLPVAVALSHKTGKALTTQPINKSKVLWIDDIIDSGAQLQQAKSQNFAGYCALLERSTASSHCLCAQVLENEDWIVFPWENKQANTIEKDYEAWLCR